MRTAFIETLVKVAEKDARVNLLVGDLGFGVVHRFSEKFPDRFVNMGVAEQNMAGAAAGMAMCGKVVFTYSISNFPTMRCMEQIRNDICYHKADVKIVCVGGGVAYGSVGATHFATEDVAMMRALPNMAVVAPCDAFEAEKATIAIVERSGPCYLRLGRVGEPDIHQPGISFELGKAITVREGRDVTLISAGSILSNAVKIADLLSAKGIQARVVSMHTIKPLDIDTVMAAAQETRAIISIEEHSIVGGLGSAIIEALADSGKLGVPVKRIGLPPEFASDVGSQEYLWSIYGLSVDGIAQTVEEFLERNL
jgi:transketolase